MAIISACNISKNYTYGKNQKKNAINKVSLNINQGEFVTIIGKSGSGKSTLLYLLSGLENADDGKILFKQKDICKMKDKTLSKLRCENFGFVFQFYNLLPNMSAEENVLLPLEMLGVSKKMRYDMVRNYFELFDCKSLMKKYPYEMSGGEQQRIAIIRALVTEPVVIFADEPTGNLDQTTSMEILKILNYINHQLKTTILMVTHDIEIAKMGDRTLEIVDGRIK